VKFLGKRVEIEIEREKLLTLIDSCFFFVVVEKVDLHKRKNMIFCVGFGVDCSRGLLFLNCCCRLVF